MIYVSADEINRCKPLLIFKEKDEIKNSRIKKKMSQYHTRVTIQWNETAWSNTTIMIRWLKHQYKYATIGFTNRDATSRLLTLNVFRGQKTNEICFYLIRYLIRYWLYDWFHWFDCLLDQKCFSGVKYHSILYTLELHRLRTSFGRISQQTH